MLVMIFLTYASDHGPMLLDYWNLEASSISAVDRLVREDLGPALRRYGRSRAIAMGFDASEYCPQALDVLIDKTPQCKLSGLLAALTDRRGIEHLGDDVIERQNDQSRAVQEPVLLVDLLSRHGIAGLQGRRLPYCKPKARPKPEPPIFDNNDDELPF